MFSVVKRFFGYKSKLFELFFSFWVDKNNRVENFNNKGKVLFSNGDLNSALRCFERALEIDPAFAAAHNNRGAVLKSLKRSREALSCFDAALKVDPDDFNALFNKGLTLLELESPREALACLDMALLINPCFFEAYNTRGVVLKELGRKDEALESIDSALVVCADYVEAHCNRGVLLRELERESEALACFSAALAIAPDYCEAYTYRGKLLLDLKRPLEALRDFDAVLVHQPNLPANYCNRGLALLGLDRPTEALSSFCDALSRDAACADAHNFRGIALARLNRLDEALGCFDAALIFNPEYADAHNNRGAIQLELNRPNEALASYEAALAIDSNFFDAIWNKSLFFLLHGCYGEGWRLYESRWMREEFKAEQRYEGPCWLGMEDIFGKTILIYPEQGLGDYIQFSRYALFLKNMGANVVLEVPKALIPVASMMKQDFKIFERGQVLPPYDYQCPVMSMPLAFGTEVNNIPAPIPYVFADKSRTEYWRNKLGGDNRLKIGLVWSGSSFHKKDHNRSINLSEFRCLLDLPVDFHSLQKDIRLSDMVELENVGRIAVHADGLNDFSDTAGLIEAMDLIISVDTSVAHLAGAMGKKVWILLPSVPDFRWMLERTDSPWYPTATLFRQSKIGDWGGVISDVKQCLEKLCLQR